MMRCLLYLRTSSRVSDICDGAGIKASVMIALLLAKARDVVYE
ncbi:Uncharacterised protein [Mycobacterium tuberculosis]|nr:Uncharacterised protein [Mycobacterium tuberculosis]CFR88196.1 Uncharacterised protein [Mycobacterium tuberculosis]CKR86019.1 Uncharacterised protein [Mycobacterium tuberculosis]CKS94318.1 Uncharacterised protein [Mycobacterium tuberculosis]CKT46966.1 Uncharacterised protein [Mycobacterium tuberculosis]